MKQTIEEQLHAFSKQKSLNMELTESLDSSSKTIFASFTEKFFRSEIAAVEDRESRFEEFCAGAGEKRAQS